MFFEEEIMKILKNGKVLSNESDNGSPEWCNFLSLLRADNKELRFLKHYKCSKQDKFEIIDQK